jgi:hypothetical protein
MVVTRRPALVAWGSACLSLLTLTGGVILAIFNHHLADLSSIPQVVAWALVGAIITTARPRNVVGWLFCALALVIAELICARNYAIYALRTDPGGLPGGNIAAWLGVWPIELTSGLVATALVLFPNGAPPTRRWRFVVAGIAAGTIVLTILSFGWDVNVTIPYNFSEATFPFSLPGLRSARAVYGALGVLSPVWFLTAAAALVRRYRLAGNEVRTQLKWVMYAVAFLGGAMVVAVFTLDYKAVIVFSMVAPLVPITAGIAILRYRLYEIDRIVNRTVVYVIVTGLLAGAYFGLVLLIEAVSPLTNDSSIVVAVSTLAIAALFGPARTRIQLLVDRRFNRVRYDATRTLQEFSVRARDEVDIDALSAALLSIVTRTMNPESVAIWLKPSVPTPEGLGSRTNRVGPQNGGTAPEDPRTETLLGEPNSVV